MSKHNDANSECLVIKFEYTHKMQLNVSQNLQTSEETKEKSSVYKISRSESFVLLAIIWLDW